ncbi:hypothetical protein L204_100349 [Cryptococcus depauperatus]
MAQNKVADTAAPRKERHKGKKNAAVANGDSQPARSKGKERADTVHHTIATHGGKDGKKRRKRLVQNGFTKLPVDATGKQNGESSTGLARRKIDGESWEPLPVAQYDVSRIPPVWSKDGRFYFTVIHNAVHIHSSSTNFPHLSTLSSTHPNGHTKPITSLHLSPINPFQILTSSLDGTIKFWDWVAGRLVRTIEFRELEARVEHIAFGQVVGKWWLFAAVTHPKSGLNGQKLAYRILRSPLSGNADPILFGKLSNPPVSLIMSPRSTYLVALASTKAYTYRMPIKAAESLDPWEERPTCVKFVSDQPFTCGAFCPEKILRTNEEEWFATGDQKGVIRLWHGLIQAFQQVDATARTALGGTGDTGRAALPETERRLPTTSLHWHAHAVSAIAFTPSGSQLLSVGEESVLVQWHLASGRREYVPRLGGRPIVSLAVRNATRTTEEEWWMALSDGAVIRVGASSGHIANVGQGVRLDPLRPSSPTTPYPISLHPSTCALVIPSSHPSTLQFIDPISSTVLFDLEVAPSNRASRRDEKQLEPVRVEKVAFSEENDGKSIWMATVEGKEGDEVEGGGMVRNLKFWKWVGENYMVNTQYPKPHCTSNLSSLIFSPLRTMSGIPKSNFLPNPYLLTTSTDGIAKLWHVKQLKKNGQGKASIKKTTIVEEYWSCRSTFNYRNLSIHSSAFSPDASILALSHGDVVTLWDVENNSLLKVLDCGLDTVVMNIGFVGAEGRYLVGTGKKGAIVWDMLSCEVSWTLPDLEVDCLVASFASPFFLISSCSAIETSIQILSPVCITPIRKIHVATQICRLVALPTHGAMSTSSLHLIGVAPSGEIFRFGDISSPTASASSAAKSINQARAKDALSVWQEMFGKGAFLEELSLEEEKVTTTATSALQRRIANTGRPADVFQGPSHTLPSSSLLFEAFMDELLSGHTAPSNKVEKLDDVVGNSDYLYF